VLGISGDTPFSHAEFHKRHALPFPLLSDVHRSVIQAYGVWDEERNVAYRSTVVVDREGRVREIYSTAFLHPEAMLNDIRTLLMEEDARR